MNYSIRGKSSKYERARFMSRCDNKEMNSEPVENKVRMKYTPHKLINDRKMAGWRTLQQTPAGRFHSKFTLFL